MRIAQPDGSERHREQCVYRAITGWAKMLVLADPNAAAREIQRDQTGYIVPGVPPALLKFTQAPGGA